MKQKSLTTLLRNEVLLSTTFDCAHLFSSCVNNPPASVVLNMQLQTT